jgi:hypothetical protein
MNYKYRPQLLEKIDGVILLGDKNEWIKSSLFNWLGMRRIYLIKMLIEASDFNLAPSRLTYNYMDQFREEPSEMIWRYYSYLHGKKVGKTWTVHVELGKTSLNFRYRT